MQCGFDRFAATNGLDEALVFLFRMLTISAGHGWHANTPGGGALWVVGRA